MASGPASFCLKNHLQNPLLEILQEIPCIFRVTLEEKIIGIESEIYRKRAERSGASAIPRPRNFLIFPLPFLIFSRAPEHSTPVRFLAKLENDFAPYRLFSAILRGTAGAKSFFFFAKRHTDFPFLQIFAPPGAIFRKNGFSVCPKKAFQNILF